MHELIIEPGRAERNYWRDLWRFRELFYFLAWRDLLVRYKQTVIGVAWALLRPALTMLVFTAFRKIAKLPSGGVPDPLLVLLTFGLSVGAGLLLAALNVKYRDFRYIVPFIVQFGLFVSPIAISTRDVPQEWRFLYSLNPMAGVIDGFRWSLLAGKTPFDPTSLLSSILGTIVLLATGVWYFRRTEKTFADVI